MSELRETSIECVSEKNIATFCSNEQKWINKLRKLAKDNPGCVNILEEPDDNWGYMLAHIPKSWMKVQPPKKVKYTDEQKAAVAERMSNARKSRKNKSEED